MMSPGSTSMTRRQNSNHHSARVPSLCDQRRGTRCEAKQRSCYWRFFDSEGIVHEYTPDGQTINKEFYLEVLQRLRESVHWKWPEKWWDGDWILHHDNAPAHTSHLVQQFLAKHGTAQLQQLPYSPDLAPCDFFLFPRLKKVLKGHRFEATEDIKRNSTKTLLDIPKEEFEKCFQQWQQRWAKCVAAEGELYWRQLGLKPLKPYLLHVLWSVRILFGQISYILLKANVLSYTSCCKQE